ncbi:MAG: hypothetical protein RIC55_36445 [Pirellulaceae bacterium]
MTPDRTRLLLEAKRKYKELPWLRRDTTCQAILGGALALMLVGTGSIYRLARLAEDDVVRIALFVVGLLPVLGFVLAVLLVCGITLTGPVYKSRLDFERGELDRWGLADKIAAAVFVLLALGGMGFIIYWGLSSSP